LTNPGTQTVDELKGGFQGEILLPGNTAYDAARSV
jgi:hypothetical protein